MLLLIAVYFTCAIGCGGRIHFLFSTVYTIRKRKKENSYRFPYCKCPRGLNHRNHYHGPRELSTVVCVLCRLSIRFCRALLSNVSGPRPLCNSLLCQELVNILITLRVRRVWCEARLRHASPQINRQNHGPNMGARHRRAARARAAPQASRWQPQEPAKSRPRACTAIGIIDGMRATPKPAEDLWSMARKHAASYTCMRRTRAALRSG